MIRLHRLPTQTLQASLQEMFGFEDAEEPEGQLSRGGYDTLSICDFCCGDDLRTLCGLF